MRILKSRPSVPLVVLFAAAVVLVLTGVVLASESSSPAKVCVPEKPAKPILSPTSGAGKTGYTLTEIGKSSSEGGGGGEEKGSGGGGGASVLARVRGELTVSSEFSAELASPGANDPLTDASWSQGGNELNELVGEVTLTTPTKENCSRLTPGGKDVVGKGVVSVLMNGKLVGTVKEAAGKLESSTANLPIKWTEEGGHPTTTLLLWEPGSEIGRTLSVRAADNCGEGGGSSGGHFKVEEVKVDVLGVP